MRVVAYSSPESWYTVTTGEVGNITGGNGKMADARINYLGGWSTYKYFTTTFTTSILYIQTEAPYVDTAISANVLSASFTFRQCKTPNGVQSCVWNTLKMGGNYTYNYMDFSDGAVWENDHTRIFTDHGGTYPQCFGVGSGVRCYNAGHTTGAAILTPFTLYVRPHNLAGLYPFAPQPPPSPSPSPPPPPSPPPSPPAPSPPPPPPSPPPSPPSPPLPSPPPLPPSPSPPPPSPPLPPVSCVEILARKPTSVSGWYDITPASKPASVLRVWCDMSTGGGGYTFYACASCVSVSTTTEANGCDAVGLRMVIPRTQAMWGSMKAFVGRWAAP